MPSRLPRRTRAIAMLFRRVFPCLIPSNSSIISIRSSIITWGTGSILRPLDRRVLDRTSVDPPTGTNGSSSRPCTARNNSSTTPKIDIRAIPRPSRTINLTPATPPASTRTNLTPPKTPPCPLKYTAPITPTNPTTSSSN